VSDVGESPCLTFRVAGNKVLRTSSKDQGQVSEMVIEARAMSGVYRQFLYA
jgi:hypothetical protein